jgi:hypothetical protein
MNNYTETNGKFVFTGLNAGDTIYCEMTNTAFPDLMLRTTWGKIITANFSIPSNLRSVQTAQTVISLQWNKVEGATEYVLQRKGPGESEFKTIYTGTNAKFIDQKLTAGTTYQYQVQAIGSVFSNAVSITTAASSVNGNPVTDSPLIFSGSVQNGKATITWTNLGEDYTYTVFKAGRIVASSYKGNSFTDSDPLAIAEYAVRAFSRVTQRSSTVSTIIVWNTVKPVEFTGYEVEPNGIKLQWDAQVGTTYQIMRSGKILASNLTTGEWTDRNPQAENAYVIVASYQEYDATLGRTVTRRTYSNVFSVRGPQNQFAALNTFWSEYALNDIEDELFLLV